LSENYDELFSIKEQNLRKAARKKAIIGVLLLVSVIALPILVFYIQFLVSSIVITVIFVIFFVIAMTGLVMLGWYGKGASLFFLSLDQLKKLSPPDPIIVGYCAVMNKDPVYVIGTWGSNVLMFVGFYSYERAFHQKLKIPRNIWKWEYKFEINDVKVARREGTYTVPIDNDEYYTGEGILYALMLEGGVYIVTQRDFMSEQLHQIVGHLENEVVSYGSSKHHIDSQGY
jgi:hypothetical protein